jgi:16S rRNA (cytosine1402-N4)-methyltransferase
MEPRIAVGERAMSTLTYMPTDHEAVLAPELVALLDPEPGDLVVDCTFGAGGHARLIAERIGPTGTLVCIDRDPTAELKYEEFAAESLCQSRFEHGNFADVLARLGSEGLRPASVYMDLGVSSMQLDSWERGFSYSYDAPLDMRMDPGQPLSARELIDTWPEDRLAQTIRELGEERHARSIAAEIVRRRPLETTAELVEAIRDAVPPAYRFGRGHPAKRTFQAIRIAVNGELDAVDLALPLAWELLEDGGRLGVISFHSLEDRRAKRYLAERAKGCICPPEFPICTCGREPEAELLTRRAVAPSDDEAERNPRSRSAHLRVARKIGAGTGEPTAKDSH